MTSANSASKITIKIEGSEQKESIMKRKGTDSNRASHVVTYRTTSRSRTRLTSPIEREGVQ